MRGKLVSALVLSFVVLAPGLIHAEQAAPKDVIQKFNDALLESMKKGQQLGYSGRYKLLEPVMRNTFAFKFMGSKVTGRYWNTLSRDQQELFLDTYTEWSIATYAGRFNEYSGERFEIASAPPPSDGTATVVSKLVKSNDDTVDFHYVLRQINGQWRVVDIRIEGVSQLALTRSQFTNTIKDKGFDGLIAMLKEKINAFSQKK